MKTNQLSLVERLEQVCLYLAQRTSQGSPEKSPFHVKPAERLVSLAEQVEQVFPIACPHILSCSEKVLREPKTIAHKVGRVISLTYVLLGLIC